MDWHYGENGQQKDPVDDAAIAKLVNLRNILPDTLIWSTSLPKRQPYRSLFPHTTPPQEEMIAYAHSPHPDSKFQSTHRSQEQRKLPQKISVTLFTIGIILTLLLATPPYL